MAKMAPMPKSTRARRKAAEDGKLEQMTLPDPKPHTRTAKPSEAELLERGRRLVANLLVQRDGMDPEVASIVVQGMDPDTINTLIVEANTTVIYHAKESDTYGWPSLPTGTGVSILPTQPAPEAPRPPASLDAPSTQEQGAPLAPDTLHVDFLSVPALAASADLVDLTFALPALAKAKQESEAKYKAEKAKIIKQIRDAGVLKVAVTDWKVTVFQGGNAYIDELMLIEQGVDPAIIKKCTKHTPFWDVKVTPPPTPKPGGEQ